MGGKPPPSEREWLPEAALLVLSALAVMLLLGVSSLDIAAARWFYRPAGADHWPLAARAPWPLLYRASPWITASLVIAGLATLAAGTLFGRRLWRRHAILVLSSVVVGPGLLGNVLFKDHWNHPRPREIVQFGGALRYVPTPLPGREAGASFPCGHCTVGFLYGIGWWIWKRRRAWALASLSSGLIVGGLLGVGRMAAGAHFLSDVLWSALLAAGVTHLLYYHVLRLPRDEVRDVAPIAARHPEWRWLRVSTLAAVLGGSGVLVALFATPHGTPLDTVVSLASLPQAPRVLEVQARKGTIEIALVDTPTSQVTIRGELHGFGLPLSRLGAHVEFVPDPVPKLLYRIEQHGLFTDLDGFASLRVPAGGLELVGVRLGEGDIRVTDATRAGLVARGILRLDLHTGAGHIQVP